MENISYKVKSIHPVVKNIARQMGISNGSLITILTKNYRNNRLVQIKNGNALYAVRGTFLQKLELDQLS